MKEEVKESRKRQITRNEYKRLQREGAKFFAAKSGREETKAFEKASLRTLGRD